ncbi:jg23426 [Pararge aegeria aegeria]|uniref:Jg23426 protein n=1 Tax=Pararge aegeria aegeria TaxID=348720 RepID=A0A8S4QGB6_9NEOP|nr:jg23426 [Pararge aegeria aegeria]
MDRTHMQRRDDHAVRRALALPESERRRRRHTSTWWTTVAKDNKYANMIDVTTLRQRVLAQKDEESRPKMMV